MDLLKVDGITTDGAVRIEGGIIIKVTCLLLRVTIRCMDGPGKIGGDITMSVATLLLMSIMHNS